MELDSARIEPSVKLPEAARLCACVVAAVIRLGSEQVCDCANCCETCVPAMLNDIVSPLFAIAIFCCSVVKVATVALVFERGAGKAKIPLQAGGSCTVIVVLHGAELREIRGRDSRSLQGRQHVVQAGIEARLDTHRKNCLIRLQTGSYWTR